MKRYTSMKYTIRNVVIYFVLGILWILFTDQLVNTFIKDSNTNALISSSKGVLFVVVTAIYIYHTSRSSLNRIDKLHKELVASEVSKAKINAKREKMEYQLKNVNALVDKIFELSSRVISSGLSNDEFIKEVFDLAFQFELEWNLGSAFIVERDYVRFLKAVGFDVNILNELKLDPAKFMISDEDIIIVNQLDDSVNPASLFTEKDGEEYKRPLKGASMYIGVSDGMSFVGGISLDRITTEEFSFSDETVQKFKLFQRMFNGLYKLKMFSDVQKETQKDIVRSLVTALEIHDKYTSGHSSGVAVVSKQIGIELGLNPKKLDELYQASMVHDIGKILIPESILNKAERLTEEEFMSIKLHSTHGYNILKESDTLSNIAKYVLHHHERWDGKGYPYGLLKDEIPLLSQILCVADAFNAMVTERVYASKMSIDDALREIRDNKGTQFSPKVVDALLKCMGAGEKLE